ncbi:MAG: hypothetical protein ACHQ1H_10700 [Nitrososphaerales archaeon]
MVFRKGSLKVFLLSLLLMIVLLAPSVVLPLFRVSSGVTGVATLCSALPNGDYPLGIYPITGGALVEGANSGKLYFCGGGTSRLVASVPAGGSTSAYQGMGGIKTTANGIVLALTSFGTPPGLWLCKHASATGCGSKSSYIALPSSFCKGMPKGGCLPVGTALDKSLNVYYVDGSNEVLVECTAASHYQSCSVLPGSSALSGHNPQALFLNNGEFYVGDTSCTGTLWAGTGATLNAFASMGDYATSITISNKNPQHSPHIYVGIAGSCTATPGHVLDYNDGITLPTPFKGPALIYGLDSSLQFTGFISGGTYRTTDSA